jgi:perosamine synthetase
MTTSEVMTQRPLAGTAPDETLAIFGGTPVRPKPIEATIVISDRVRQRVAELLDAGLLSDYYSGPWARKFEEAFVRYYGPDYEAVSVNSGTSALHLALAAAGVRAGDEVIVPSLCFVAAAIAVVQIGAIPVICDAEPEHLTMDVAHAQRLISKRTKAILPVHFWGYPSDVTSLRSLCDRYGLSLIEDCAQAFGATVAGEPVGSTADYATFAFSVRKHIACGEGGMVLCRNAERQDRLRMLSNYGKGPGWDDYVILGYSYRMAEFPAIVALEGLEQVDAEIRARQEAAQYYVELLGGTELTVVPEPSWGHSVFFKCPVLLPPDIIPRRKQIVDAIKNENVSCRVPHRPLYSIPWVAEYLKEQGAFRGPEGCPTVAAMHPRLFEIETGPNLPMEEARLSGHGVTKVWRYFSTMPR